MLVILLAVGKVVASCYGGGSGGGRPVAVVMEAAASTRPSNSHLSPGLIDTAVHSLSVTGISANMMPTPDAPDGSGIVGGLPGALPSDGPAPGRLHTTRRGFLDVLTLTTRSPERLTTTMS